MLSVLLPSAGYSQTDSSVDSNPKVQQRLQELKAMKGDLLRKMQDFDNRIHTLEAEVKRQKSETAKIAAKADSPSAAAAADDGCSREPTRESGRLYRAAAAADGCGGESTSKSAIPTAKPSAPASLTNFNVGNFNIKIFGAATLDVFYNTARPQAPGVPFFLDPKFPGGFSQHTLDINARQSQVGVAFTGPMIGNFQSGGKDISGVFRQHHPGRP